MAENEQLKIKINVYKKEKSNTGNNLVKEGKANKSGKAGKVRNLKCGTVVKIIGEKNGWGKISNENWINLKYTKKVTTAKEYKIKITATTLNVRSGPSTNYKTVQTLSKNGVYTIVDEKDGWGKLKSGAGWISLKYTEKGQ